jgi:hypothetical protein
MLLLKKALTERGGGRRASERDGRCFLDVNEMGICWEREKEGESEEKGIGVCVCW